MKITWQDIVIIIVFCFCLLLPYFNSNQEYGEEVDYSGVNISKPEGRIFYPLVKDDSINLDMNNIETYYSVLVDLDRVVPDKILLKKNDDKRIPMASVTKLMTAVIVLDNYSLDDEIVINHSDLSVEGNMKSLRPGQVLTVKELLYIMLIDSNNGASEALARKMGRDDFIKKMNNKARLLKMANTYYFNPSGLDLFAREEANMTSVYDLVDLMVTIMRDYPLVSEILSLDCSLIQDKSGFYHNLSNTNTLINYNERVLWGKTGFTIKANGCLVMVSLPKNFLFSQKRYIIDIVLGSDDRFESMKKIINWHDNQFKW